MLRFDPQRVGKVLDHRGLRSPADAAQASCNAAAALRSGGTIYIAGGSTLDNDQMGPRAAVFLNVTFLNLYPAAQKSCVV